MAYERLERRINYKGKIVEMCTDVIALPNGKKVEWDLVHHKGAAAILPVDSEGNLILVRQFRNGPQAEILEIPAGGLNEGEDFLTCATRELEEEIGYKAEEVHHLIDLYTTIAFCDEKIGIYYTEKMTPSKQNLDEDEFVTIEKYPLQEVVDMILGGQIQDSKTMAAVLAYKELISRRG